jgi:hypothetical protein
MHEGKCVPHSKENIMDKLDKMIAETLDDEDRQILERIGQEQSYVGMTLDLFRGKVGLLNAALLFGQLLFSVIGVYAAIKCFTVTDTIEVVRYGFTATVALIFAAFSKMGLFPALQANRMLRAIKHLEMQIALMSVKR